MFEFGRQACVIIFAEFEDNLGKKLSGLSEGGEGQATAFTNRYNL